MNTVSMNRLRDTLNIQQLIQLQLGNLFTLVQYQTELIQPQASSLLHMKELIGMKKVLMVLKY